LRMTSTPPRPAAAITEFNKPRSTPTTLLMVNDYLFTNVARCRICFVFSRHLVGLLRPHKTGTQTTSTANRGGLWCIETRGDVDRTFVEDPVVQCPRRGLPLQVPLPVPNGQ
jgi:hypothetical protein